MSISCGFYNSVNGDRKYNTKQISAIFDGIINDGVFAGVDGYFQTTPGGGMSVVVAPGRAWFDHTWTRNDAPLPLALDPSEVAFNRIDAVVLEVNSSDSVRDNTIKIIKGIPGSSPSKPVLNNTDEVHQYALAYVDILAGAQEIELKDITITVGKEPCPFVTAILETTNITDLLAKWEAEFDYWFENVKTQLEGDVAMNLQKQVDERVKISDKATTDEAQLGESNDKWVTPKTMKEAIQKFADPNDVFPLGYVGNFSAGPFPKGFVLANGTPIFTDPSQVKYPEYAEISSRFIRTDRALTTTEKVPQQVGAIVHRFKSGVWLYISGVGSNSGYVYANPDPNPLSENWTKKATYGVNTSGCTKPFRVLEFDDAYFVALRASAAKAFELVRCTDLTEYKTWSPVYSWGAGWKCWDVVAYKNVIYILGYDIGVNKVFITYQRNSGFTDWDKVEIGTGQDNAVAMAVDEENSKFVIFYSQSDTLVKSIFDPETKTVTSTKNLGIKTYSGAFSCTIGSGKRALICINSNSTSSRTIDAVYYPNYDESDNVIQQRCPLGYSIDAEEELIAPLKFGNSLCFVVPRATSGQMILCKVTEFGPISFFNFTHGYVAYGVASSDGNYGMYVPGLSSATYSIISALLPTLPVDPDAHQNGYYTAVKISNEEVL